MEFDHTGRVTAAAESAEIATAAFLTFLEKMSEQECLRPLPGGWSPAQHAAHLALTNDVFRCAILGGGPIEPFVGGSAFTDDAWSMDTPPPAVAPPIIVPPAAITRAEAAAQLRKSIDNLSPVIRSMTPERASMAVRLPWAVVSLYQMTEWTSGHTIRHIVQVNRERQQGVVRPIAVG